MCKIKVREAIGPVLDWMVGYARSLESTNGKPILARDLMNAALRNSMASPSTDWSQGGPILSKLGAENGLQLTTHVTSTAASCGWRASCDFPNGFYFGETALIAAMRCYVASKLGNEVEVPEGLCHGA